MYLGDHYSTHYNIALEGGINEQANQPFGRLWCLPFSSSALAVWGHVACHRWHPEWQLSSQWLGQGHQQDSQRHKGCRCLKTWTLLAVPRQLSPHTAEAVVISLLADVKPGDLLSPLTGLGCHSLLQGIFLTQGSKPGLLHCRWSLHCLSHQGSL